ncbi:MAG: DUF4214 domain-containing protein [Acidobacteriota bacterium]|nr:DUF4214 domain-containing protein [Acidobacteriota bacterium]
MMRRRSDLRILFIAVVTCLALTFVGRAVSADGGDVVNQINLSGPAINNLTPKGVAELRTRADGTQEFKVEAEDVNLPAGTVLNVLVNGTSVGSLTIDSFREGELELESENGQMIPKISAGSTVAVKSQAGTTIVSGTFSSVSQPPTPTPTPTPKDDRAKTTVQFGAPSYTVAEDAKSLAVTVTRTGDLSRNAKVDYKSIDGTAHERSDYTTASGRLFFAPGEASKTITVLITDDSFVEGDENFFLMLTDASDSTDIGTPGTVTITIKDNDTSSSVANSIDDNKIFVTQHYMDFLNREPEPRGLQAWQDILNKCGKDDKSCDRIEVSSAFFRSPEFQDRGYFLYRFYSTSLGRIPRYVEFEKDMSRTSGFQTEAEQEANKGLFADDFVTRQEFKDLYDRFTNAADFVNALLATAGVTIANKDALIAALQSGQLTRAQVLRAISESDEVKQKFYTESFVVMQYFGYLRRDPDILYLEWIKIMKQNGGAYRDMINGFMNSVEYRGRFGK